MDLTSAFKREVREAFKAKGQTEPPAPAAPPLPAFFREAQLVNRTLSSVHSKLQTLREREQSRPSFFILYL